MESTLIGESALPKNANKVIQFTRQRHVLPPPEELMVMTRFLEIGEEGVWKQLSCWGLTIQSQVLTKGEKLKDKKHKDNLDIEFHIKECPGFSVWQNCDPWRENPEFVSKLQSPNSTEASPSRQLGINEQYVAEVDPNNLRQLDLRQWIDHPDEKTVEAIVLNRGESEKQVQIDQSRSFDKSLRSVLIPWENALSLITQS